LAKAEALAQAVAFGEGGPYHGPTMQASSFDEPAADVSVCMPTLDDLLRTKRFSARPEDLEDIRMLEALKGEDGLG
jgi:hypothetical protein